MELKDLKVGDFVKETTGGYYDDFLKSTVSRITKTLIVLTKNNGISSKYEVKFNKYDGTIVPYRSMSSRIYPWNSSHEVEYRELIREKRNEILLGKVKTINAKSLSDIDYNLLSKLIIKYKVDKQDG